MQTGLYRHMCHAWCLAWQYHSHWAWQPVGGLHPLLMQHLLKDFWPKVSASAMGELSG